MTSGPPRPGPRGKIFLCRQLIVSAIGRSLTITAVGGLRAYKWAISPLLPPACRYLPTCSEYAIQAIERYGVLGGGARAIGRLLRCHPLAKGGYDPLPDKERNPARMADSTTC